MTFDVIETRNFTNWFDSASEFWRGSRCYASRRLLKHAAFLPHQAAAAVS